MGNKFKSLLRRLYEVSLREYKSKITHPLDSFLRIY